jgi:translation initiation factor 1
MSNRLIYQEFGSNSEALSRPETGTDSKRSPAPPSEQSPRIQASRKGRKGKTVTIITGLQEPPATLDLLLKQLKTQCGAGGTLKNLESDPEIEIQGDHAPKILQILIKLGYKAKISGN